MNVAVLVKRTPDTATKVKVTGTQIDETGVKYVVNPYDEFAVEAALQVKEAAGSGSVTVLSLGPKDATSTIRDALARGADSGVHIPCDEQLRDAASIAKTLAAAIGALDPKPDLILCGRQSVDAQALAVGPMLATFLGYPCVTDIAKLTVEGQTAKVEREFAGETFQIEVTLPAVLTTDKGLNEPRYPKLKGIMQAKRKKIVASDVALAPARTTIATMTEPPARQGGRIVGEGAAAVPQLVELLRNEAKAL